MQDLNRDFSLCTLLLAGTSSWILRSAPQEQSGVVARQEFAYISTQTTALTGDKTLINFTFLMIRASALAALQQLPHLYFLFSAVFVVELDVR
jgi:hypothetical protein